jgi:hypothetical protein
MAWGLFACAAVALRGVRWDEDYEFAQVLLGRVTYPEGHALPRHVFSLLSLQHWTLAAWMWVCSDALSPNALRNVLFLLATVLPPYLLARTLSGQAVWGVAAALLCLAGIHVPFYSTYPVQVWPDLYSNGHLGTAWVLLALWAFLDGRPRTAWLLTGLAPAIHLGQAPPLLLLAGVVLLAHLRQRDAVALRDAAQWGGAGLLVSVLVALWAYFQALPDPVSGGYTDPTSADAVFRGYMMHWATHRSIPWGTGHLAVAGAVALAFLAACAPGARCARLLLGYLLALCGLVYGSMLVHLAMGSDMPRVLIAWMPYRLMNHAAPILIALAVAGLARHTGGLGAALVCVALAGLALRPLLEIMLPAAIFARYVAEGDAVLFALWGAAMIAYGQALPAGRRRWGVALGLGLLIALAPFHGFGAVCALLGAACAWGVSRMRLPSTYTARAGWGCAMLLALVLLGGQYANRTPLPRAPFEAEAARYLAAHNAPQRLVLAHYQQEGLQARLNQPMVADMATMTWIPYKPSLGPALYRLYRDCFGVNFAPAAGEQPTGAPWDVHWAGHSPAQWQALGARYGIGFVIAPRSVGVQLPEVVAVEGMGLYAVPE